MLFTSACTAGEHAWPLLPLLLLPVVELEQGRRGHAGRVKPKEDCLPSLSVAGACRSC
jgi:hypothetical protein